MAIGKRLAVASTITMLAGAGTAWAAPVPPKSAATFPGVIPAAAAPAPAVPTFVNGMAQAVFADGSASWVNHELWVELDVDSRRRRQARTASTPTSRARRETDTDGLKVPVIFEDSPYYAGAAERRRTGASTTSSASRPPRASAPPDFTAAPTRPQISHGLREPRGCRAASRVVHAESPGSGNSTAARTPARRSRRSARPRSSTGSTAARKGYTTRAGTTEVAAYWHNGNIGDDGHVLQRHDPDRRRVHRRRGPEGDRPDLRDLRLVRLLPRQRHGPRAAPPGGFQGEDLDVLSRVRLLAQRRGPARARSAGR